MGRALMSLEPIEVELRGRTGNGKNLDAKFAEGAKLHGGK
jgi:hypothetical protein